jgi:AcrR family transcriptional regulator
MKNSSSSFSSPELSSTDSPTRDRILEQSQSLFFKIGVRNVTMDDIARELGISKKTIYQHFKNKAEIVREVSVAHCQQNEKEAVEIAHTAENAIDELFKVMVWVSNTIKKLAPNLIFEVQKYYPESWKLFQKHENRFVLGMVKENLRRGMDEGLYREDIDIEIIARMRMAQVNASFDEDLLPNRKFPRLKVQLQMLEMYMRGLATPKGLKLIEQYMSQNQHSLI